MTSSKCSLRLKKATFHMVLALCASSLFAYVLLTIFYPPENQKNKIEKTSFMAPHPLVGNSDNVVICPNDGNELHEIYLGGASPERLIITNIPSLKQIIWGKLQDGSCSAAQTNCTNTSPSCTWNQVSTNTQFYFRQERLVEVQVIPPEPMYIYDRIICY